MASQLPRPWFRLGSITRPTTAPNPEQPRPVQPRVRPPIIRPAVLTDPAEPTTPQRSKSPPPLPRPASLTPPMKNAASPLRVLPSPSSGQGGGTAMASPAVNPSSPKERSSSVVGSPKGRSSSVVGSPKGRSSSVVGSPKTNNSKQPSPFPSPSIPKSIPSVPTPYQSPKPKTVVSPPSPLVLPPPQLQSVAEIKHESIPQEVERKTVVFQKVMDKPSQAEEHHHLNITNYRTHTSEFDKNGKQESNKSDDGDHHENGINKNKGTIVGGNNNYKRTAFDHDSNARVITMAGENKGAFMEINLSSDKNNNSRHQQQQNQDNNIVVSPKDNNKSKNKTKGIKTRNVLPMRAFFNSNVQGINNSILMDSKFSHHDPGIHLVFSSIPTSPDDEDDQQHQ